MVFVVFLVLALLIAILLYFLPMGHCLVAPTRQAVLIDKIEGVLPQTQCGQCGYPACRPYAQAIVLGQANIDACPPGGVRGLQALSRLTGKPYTRPVRREAPTLLAVITEQDCIGCVKCVEACPVDAIIGARKQIHSVMPQYCTGCELCVAACPVDCIHMRAT